MRSIEDIDAELRGCPDPVRTEELLDERNEVMRDRERRAAT